MYVSNPVLHHCNHIFTWSGGFILHKNDVVSCETVGAGEWIGLHIYGYGIICKCLVLVFGIGVWYWCFYIALPELVHTTNAAHTTQVLQIPLEECANFTDCENCISYNNPLCGWCTVKDKCSRRSQCQNAAEPVRWVQNSSQCISTTITPNQFVLDNPEIVSALQS